MAEILRVPEAMRGDIKLIRHIGDVWMRTNIKVKDSLAGYGTRQVDIYMGCLKDNWKLKSTVGTEEIPFSCTSGAFTLSKDKRYSVEIGTKNLPPLLMAAVMGMKISQYFEGTTEKVLVEEKLTLPLSIESEGDGSSTISLSPTITDADHIVKIVSMRRKKDKSWWSLSSSASETDRTFTLSGDALGTPSINFEYSLGTELTDGEEFTLIVQHQRTMTADDFVLREDGTTFPNSADFVLSWLTKVESGAERGKKGCLIAKVNNCMRTGDFDLGGDAQEISEGKLEYAVNFEEEGDVELHFAWLS